MRKSQSNIRIKSNTQTRNKQSTKSTYTPTNLTKKQSARNTNNFVQSTPRNQQKRGAAAQIAMTAKINKRSTELYEEQKLLAYQTVYNGSLNRTTAFFEWASEAQQFKTVEARQRRHFASSLISTRKLDVAAVKKYVTNKKRHGARRSKRRYASFYSKRTKSFYLIRNKDIARKSLRSLRSLRSLKSKQRRFSLTYYKQTGFERSQSQIRPFEPTLRSFWQFLENYKISVCSELTAAWRKEQREKLSVWAYKYALFPGLPRFYIISRICTSLNRIAKGMHPDERRVRLLQRQYERWCVNRPRSLSKGRKWLTTETKEIGKYLYALNYTWATHEAVSKLESECVPNIIRQVRLLRKIVVRKQCNPRLSNVVKKVFKKLQLLKNLRKIRKLQRTLRLSKYDKRTTVRKTRKRPLSSKSKPRSKPGSKTKPSVFTCSAKPLQVKIRKKIIKKRKSVKPALLKNLLLALKKRKTSTAIKIRRKTKAVYHRILYVALRKKLAALKARKLKLKRALNANLGRKSPRQRKQFRNLVRRKKQLRKARSSTLRQWTQFVWRFLSPETRVHQKKCVPGIIKIRRFRLKKQKVWETRRRFKKRKCSKKRNFPTTSQKMKYMQLRDWSNFESWTKADHDTRSLRRRCWRVLKMYSQVKVKSVWRSNHDYGRAKIKKPKLMNPASRHIRRAEKKEKQRLKKKMKIVAKLPYSTKLSATVKLNFFPVRHFSVQRKDSDAQRVDNFVNKLHPLAKYRLANQAKNRLQHHLTTGWASKPEWQKYLGSSAGVLKEQKVKDMGKDIADMVRPGTKTFNKPTAAIKRAIIFMTKVRLENKRHHLINGWVSKPEWQQYLGSNAAALKKQKIRKIDNKLKTLSSFNVSKRKYSTFSFGSFSKRYFSSNSNEFSWHKQPVFIDNMIGKLTHEQIAALKSFAKKKEWSFEDHYTTVELGRSFSFTKLDATNNRLSVIEEFSKAGSVIDSTVVFSQKAVAPKQSSFTLNGPEKSIPSGAKNEIDATCSFENLIVVRHAAKRMASRAKKLRRLMRRSALIRQRRKAKQTRFAKSSPAVYVHPTRRIAGSYDRVVKRVLFRKRWTKLLKQLGPVKQWNENYKKSDRTLARKLSALRFRLWSSRGATKLLPHQTRLSMKLQPTEVLTNFHVDNLPFKAASARSNEKSARLFLERPRSHLASQKVASANTLTTILANFKARVACRSNARAKVGDKRLRFVAQDYGRLSFFSASKKRYRRQLARRQTLLKSFLQSALKVIKAKVLRRVQAKARRRALIRATRMRLRSNPSKLVVKKVTRVFSKKSVNRVLKTSRALRIAARRNLRAKIKNRCQRMKRNIALAVFSAKLLRESRQKFIKVLTTPTKPRSFLKYGNAKKQTRLKRRRKSKRKSFGKTVARTIKMLTQNLSPRGRKGKTWWAKKRNGTVNKVAWARKVREVHVRRALRSLWHASAHTPKTLRVVKRLRKWLAKTSTATRSHIDKRQTKKRNLLKQAKTVPLTVAERRAVYSHVISRSFKINQRARSLAWHQRKYTKLQVDTKKTASVWDALKRADEKALLLRLAFYAPAYSLRSRLIMRKNRKLCSRQEIYQQKLTNKRRWVAARSVYGSRQKIASAWNKANRPFRRKASISTEERRKRDMYKLRWLDEKALKDKARSGQPIISGYRRLRRTLVPLYNKTRWWKPSALPLPHYHPYALYPRNTRESKKSSLLQKFRRVSALLPTAKATFLREINKKNTLASELLVANNPLVGDKLKNTVLPKNWNATAFFTEERLWKNNTSWQLLEKGVVQSKNALTNQSEHSVGKALVAHALTALESNYASAWQRYSVKQSAAAADWLRNHFIESSARWLSNRPIEKLVSTWTPKAWVAFRAFYVLGEATVKANSLKGDAFRLHFIQSTRDELFQDFPNWWIDETKTRANDLFQKLEIGLSPDVIVKNINASAQARNLFETQRGFGWQEKKLLIFASLHLAKRDDTGAFSRALTLGSSEEGDLGDKPFTSLYYRWLAGIETHLKKANKLRSSHDYNDLRGDTVTNLDTDRPRFRGAGRKKNSFDAFLRKGYSKTMPPKQRRLGSSSLRQLRPNISGLRITKTLKLESLAGQRRSKRFSNKTLLGAYPTRQQRELFAIQKKNQGFTKNAYKGRFMSLPLSLMKIKKDKYVRNLRAKHIINFSGNNEALMQVALQKRYVTREIRDLRKAGRRRRVSAGSGPLPFWMKWKKERRTQAAERYVMYQFPETQRYQRSRTTNWTFSEFALTFAKQGKRVAKILTPFGEIITSEARLAKRPRVELKRRNFKKIEANWNNATQRLKVRCNKKNPKKAVRRFKRGRVLAKKKKYYRAARMLPKRFTSNKLVQVEKAKRSLKLRLLKQTASSIHLVPLHFRNVTKHVSVSEEEKEEWRLHIRASRQRRYRRLTQISEALTSLMPQLMSRILANKMRTQKITMKQAAKLVHSMYWSLRFYLRTDYENKKFDERDRRLTRLQLLKKEITALAEERFFPLSELTRARYRFQPHNLHKGPSLKRGAIDWLRQFLPRYYELYLEDPEKYKHLTLTPIKVFRAQFGSKKTAKWKTQNVPGFMENQYRRLTSERYNVSTQRFENMLMTTRRSPVVAGYGSAASLKVISPIGSSAIKTSFFARSFHSSSRRSSAEAGLVLSRIAFLQRQTTTEIIALPQVIAASTRGRLKARAIARSRAQQIDVGTFAGPGSLDVRLLRAKSPRNAEYIQRLAQIEQRQETLADVAAYHQYVRKDASTTAVFRTSREFFASSIVNQSADEQPLRSLALQNFRKDVETRRSSTLLRVRKAVLKKAVVTSVSRRIFTRKNKARNRNFNLWIDNLKSKIKSDAKDQQLVSKTLGSNSVVSQVRSILHYRKASARVTQTLHTHKPVIINRAIQIKSKRNRRLLYSRARTKHSANKLRGKALSEPRLEKALATALLYSKYVKGRIQMRKMRAQKVRERAKKRRYKHVVERKIGLKASSFAGGMKKAKTNYAFSALNTRSKLTYATQSASYLELQKSKKFTYYHNFFNHTKNIRANKKSLSKYGKRVDKKQSKSMWAARRIELWRSITLRKSKKLRVLKRWLKGIKYSLKEKKHWTYQGHHALPDILFKLSRIRLRKLEWRESDERFYQQGLRNAFTFHPRERANAPWLEALTLRRSTYSFQRGEYRRHQLPREQKSRKWLQKVRKLLFRKQLSHMYIKSRRWPLLRRYNQKFHRSAFRMRNAKVSLKRFRKSSRKKPTTTGLEKSMVGFGDRLDVNLMLLNIAPTTYWARQMAKLSLLRINGKPMRDSQYRLRPGDYIEFVWNKILKFKTYFKSPYKRFDPDKALRKTSLYFPGNFAYNPTLRSAYYLRTPRPDDLRESGRINELLFRWSRLDSGLGR